MSEASPRPAYDVGTRCVSCALGAVLLVGLAAVLLVDATLVPVTSIVLVGIAVAVLLGDVPMPDGLERRLFADRDRDASGFGDVDGCVDASVERLLHHAGVLATDADGHERRLTPAFERAWTHELRHLPPPLSIDVTPLLPLDTAAARVDLDGDAVAVTVDDMVLRWWPSRTAFRADVATARFLADAHPAWSELTLADRTAALVAVRLVLDGCPDCGGRLAFDEEPTSVRSARPVYALTCRGCAARLVEAPRVP